MGDARAVTKVLSSDYGFESKMLLNATRADIIDALAALNAIAKSQLVDRVFKIKSRIFTVDG